MKARRHRSPHRRLRTVRHGTKIRASDLWPICVALGLDVTELKQTAKRLQDAEDRRGNEAAS